MQLELECVGAVDRQLQIRKNYEQDARCVVGGQWQVLRMLCPCCLHPISLVNRPMSTLTGLISTNKSVVRSWRIGGTEENLQVTAKTTDPKTHTPLTYSNSTSRIQMQTTGGRGVEQSSVSLAREKGTQNTEWMNANTMNKQHKKAQNIDGKQESPESDC